MTKFGRNCPRRNLAMTIPPTASRRRKSSKNGGRAWRTSWTPIPTIRRSASPCKKSFIWINLRAISSFFNAEGVAYFLIHAKPAKLAKAMCDHLCELRGLGVKNTTKQFVITYTHHTPSGLKNRRLRNMSGATDLLQKSIPFVLSLSKGG